MIDKVIKIGTVFFNSKLIGEIIKVGAIFLIGMVCGYAWAWKVLS